MLLEQEGLKLEDVTENFGGQPLKKLSLSYVKNMTVYKVQQIASAFSELEELTLVEGSEEQKWDGSIVDISFLFYLFIIE